MEVFTKEEILKLFSETNKAISETNKAISETNKAISETNRVVAETSRVVAETNKGIFELKENQKKTDAQLAKTDAQLAKTDALLAETVKQIAKTDASLKRLGKRYGGFSNNVGSATEEFFYNALNKKRTLNGVRFDHVGRNWRKKGHEFDIVMENGTAISVIEVKLQAHKEDIEKILTKQKKRFNEIFPEYKDYEQHWALATFSIDDELRDMAVEKGLTVLQRDGELLEYNP